MGRGDGPGRPPLTMTVHTIYITLSLREGEDDDLITFFAELPPRGRARAVMAAMRQGGVGELATAEVPIDEDELAAALDDLLF